MTRKELFTRYFYLEPVEREILQDKQRGRSERQLAKAYRPEGYSYSKIVRLRKKLLKLFGRKSWDEIIYDALEMELIKPLPRYGWKRITKPSDFLVSTIELMETPEAGKSFDKKNRE